MEVQAPAFLACTPASNELIVLGKKLGEETCEYFVRVSEAVVIDELLDNIWAMV